MNQDAIEKLLARSLKEKVTDFHAQREAVDLKAQPWIPAKYGVASDRDWFGVVPVEANGKKFVVKVSTKRSLGDGLIPYIIEKEKVPFSQPFTDYISSRECTSTVAREATVYSLSREVSELAGALPGLYGIGDEDGEKALLLERLEGVKGLDSQARAPLGFDEIKRIVRAVAPFHAHFFKMELPWAGPRITNKDRIEDESLWIGYLENARKRFPHLVTDRMHRTRRHFIETLRTWGETKDRMPATLVHNDFNPRNVGFREDGRVVILDWELASLNNPQRDLVELLAFALPPQARQREVNEVVQLHYDLLKDRGLAIDEDLWWNAFAAELKIEAIDRLGMQFLFASAFEIPYLARLNSNVEMLLSLYV